MTFFDVKNLTVKFGGLTAVDNVSFGINEGEVFTIIGPNGAGKTTLFNLISRLYTPSAGQIIFRDEDVTRLSAQQIAGRGIARTFQNIELFESASTLQNLLVGRHRHSTTRAWQDILRTKKVRAEEVAHRRAAEEVMDVLRLQRYRDITIGALPYGVRKVIEVARALCVGPTLLLLDEPSSGLNVEETNAMAEWILEINRRLRVTVLMVEHDMSLVSRVSNRVLALNYGKMMALGTAAEVQGHPDVIAAYLGT
ncbi:MULTISPECIES: ABC transporter ATP-binding protein [unclassified Bradyrhizobium]|jgi:branched-chain amino acid transport system ATP-binding protein|uniref:ABC transporter ATP-binding protein n=1 Tax=unclassified Bradyrhizobium TaxID=2631580 RepID=UPI001FF7F5E8|nr:MULTISPECIES: ABC transporter ATP-binding protein [unclassified Bradyrhizobium]MCK1294533.1 ABC transporter ATP-binding protein [Bradyrhizobium sp. 30]MCK1305322.1 ABC transporter ATP-binding protein [Bradyrhizobium sp. 45]MCK1318357.1 ABC transporter ATP-binding protein [Bradyrhizobium sp. 23]MCK1439936.1 ABC transporter ATP-binding protein [Bradyrhizobium sp. 15]MCK1508009.1 ABC transporter ATP-binding protein [Bradyrhizobium sp. 18]